MKKIIEGDKNFEDEKANSILEIREKLSEPDTECAIAFFKKYNSDILQGINIASHVMQMEVIMSLFKSLPRDMQILVNTEILSYFVDRLEDDLKG